MPSATGAGWRVAACAEHSRGLLRPGRAIRSTQVAGIRSTQVAGIWELAAETVRDLAAETVRDLEARVAATSGKPDLPRGTTLLLRGW